MFELTGKRALVTGASGAIGGAIARAFHAQGASVAISGTKRDALDKLAAELVDRVKVVPCDLSDAAAVEKLVPDAEAALEGELDILVNNAGITRDMLFARLSDEDWQKVIDVNLTAAFRLSRAVLRGMMRRRSGRIISITSIVGVTGNAGQGNYAASKAGLIGMTKSLAAEIASRSVTVNCIAPGFTASAMTDVLTDKQKAMIMERVPARRLGTRRRSCRRGRVPRLRRSSLRHRADDSRQRRHGHDLGCALVRERLHFPSISAALRLYGNAPESVLPRSGGDDFFHRAVSGLPTIACAATPFVMTKGRVNWGSAK